MNDSLTQEWILKTLIEFGLSKHEAEVYLLLHREGSKKAKDIADELKIHKRKVYRILKKLKETKIIDAKKTTPKQFQVIPIDNFIDLLIKNCLDKVNYLEEEKPKIFANWKSIFEKVEFDNAEDKEDYMGN